MAKNSQERKEDLSRPKVTRQFLKNLVVNVNPEPYSSTGVPKPEVSVDLQFTPQKNEKEIIADLTLIADCSLKSQELFHIEFVYSAHILRNKASDEELGAYLNIVLPPVITAEAKNLLSRLTAEIGICHILVDPWELADRHLHDISSSKTE